MTGIFSTVALVFSLLVAPAPATVLDFPDTPFVHVEASAGITN